MAIVRLADGSKLVAKRATREEAEEIGRELLETLGRESGMIKVYKSETADTRTCDWSKVSKEQLLASSHQHIHDVKRGLGFFAAMIAQAAAQHDFDKVNEQGIAQFHADFATGFEKTGWYDNHLRINRHHIDTPEGARDDINLIDVLEHIVDCVMAGIARSGEVTPLELPDELLRAAFQNTVELLTSQVELVDDDQAKTLDQVMEGDC